MILLTFWILNFLFCVMLGPLAISYMRVERLSESKVKVIDVFICICLGIIPIINTLINVVVCLVILSSLIYRISTSSKLREFLNRDLFNDK